MRNNNIVTCDAPIEIIMKPKQQTSQRPSVRIVVVNRVDVDHCDFLQGLDLPFQAAAQGYWMKFGAVACFDSGSRWRFDFAHGLVVVVLIAFKSLGIRNRPRRYTTDVSRIGATA